MRPSLLTVTLSVVLVTLVGWLLVVGRSLLLPFVTALIVWYLINALATGIRMIPLGPVRVPKLLAMFLALVLIFIAGMFIFNMVAGNLAQLTRDAPVYQTRLEKIFEEFTTRLHLGDQFSISDLLPTSFVTRAVTASATFLTTMAGSASLVFIYVIFLLMEQSAFDTKYAALFSSERAEKAFALRREINRLTLHYFGIKAAVSLATGLLTATLLELIGLPYASLFGFIAFLLNFIPTIGSLISVVFPTLLALVYYDTYGPAGAILIGLGLVQFVIGNLIEPKLMGSSLNLSSLVIMLSLALWGAIWGITGMVLCVPLTVVVLIICSQFQATRPIAVLLSRNGGIEDLPQTE